MRWSLSALGTFEKCGARYNFKYNLKIPEGPRHAAASRGVDFHKAIEDFISGTIQELPHELSFYHQFLTHLRSQEIYAEHKVALKKDWEPTVWEAEDAWLRAVLDLKLLTKAVQGREAAGDAERPPDTGIVYDWKTGKIYPDHDDQKSLYALTVFSEHPTVQRVRALHVYLDLGKTREVTYDRDQMHSMRDLWNSRVRKLEEATEFIPNPSFMCRYCPFSREKGGPCRF